MQMPYYYDAARAACFLMSQKECLLQRQIASIKLERQPKQHGNLGLGGSRQTLAVVRLIDPSH